MKVVLLIVLLLFVALIGIAFLKGPEIAQSMTDMAQEQMKQVADDMAQFSDRNRAFLQEQISTQKRFNPEYFADAFTEITPQEEWDRILTKYRDRMGIYTECKIEKQSVKVKSFSTEVSFSIGNRSNDDIVLGSKSKGPTSGDRGLVQCTATYANGSAKETYYWGRGKRDDEFRIWRIEITDIAISN